MLFITTIIILEILNAVSRKGVKSMESGSKPPGMNPGSSSYNMILGRCLNSSVPQFPHL